MKILHLLKSLPDETALKVIEAHKPDNEVKIIDLSKDTVQYERLVDDIFDCDKVISW